MSCLPEPEKLDEVEFVWGNKRGIGGKNRDVQFYESFTYDGVDYVLYDSVYMYKEGEPAPYIGKLVKIWQNADKSKKVKVQWFFRPSEISNYLKDAEVLENELFFASGDGKGLANINPLAAIAGKCNVVCTSMDSRNPQPSAEELQIADYVFYRIFDVKSLAISDQMDDKVGGLEVKYVFNRGEGVRVLNGPKLDSSDKDEERNVVACKETQKLAGTNDKKRSMLGAEKSSVIEVQVEEGVKSARKSCNLDDAPSKRAKFEGLVSALKVQERGGVESLTVPGNDAVHLETGATTSFNEKQKSELVKDSVGRGKDVKLTENSSFLDEKMSKTNCTLPKEAPRSGHVEDAVELEKNSKSNKDLNASQGKLSKLNSFPSGEKSESAHEKDSVGAGKDKKVGGSLSAFREGSAAINVFSRDETPRPSKTYVSPNETPKSGSNKDFDGSGQASKLVQSAVGLEKNSKLSKDMNALQGKLSKLNSFPSREKSESVHEKDSVGAGKDKKVGGNLSTCREGSAATNAVSRDETPRPSKTNVSHNETPKSGSDKDLDGSGKASKLVQSSTTSMKGPLKRSADLSKGKSSPGHEKSHEIKNIKLASDSCPREEGSLKKAKFDGTIKPSEDNKNNNMKKLKEENCIGETKDSPKCETSYDNKAKSKLAEVALKENHDEKDHKLSNDNLPKPSMTRSKGDGGKIGGQIIEVTRRPIGKSNWMKLPWEAKMKTAHEQGRLVLLQNLEPEYTSGEVEDIIWHVFQEKCTTKMVQRTAISNPYSGQAFVIFGSREAADRVVQNLDDGCLMLPNQRPLVSCVGVLPEFIEKQTSFVGHLAIDKARRQIQRELKEAVSTSHYTQNNTIEHEMAMDWCFLQSKSDKWWEQLYKQQRNELKKLANDLKLK